MWGVSRGETKRASKSTHTLDSRGHGGVSRGENEQASKGTHKKLDSRGHGHGVSAGVKLSE
ncbi:hypothetical protein BDZ97DRAFT_1835211 [Flammula alnicola]|nr:hypothetical protein BDZ97DRAFT_1835211 [Flammula alnicola]